MKKYYYARLNDNNICIEVVARVEELRDVTGYIKLPEYNESYYYRKWLGDQWSSETYEPDVDTVLQDKVDAFEVIVDSQNDTIQDLQGSNSTLVNQLVILEGTIAELMMILGGMQ